MQETQVRSLAREDGLEEEETITRSSIPAWEIPWTEGSLVGYSPQGHRESGWTEHITSFKQELTQCSYTDTGRQDSPQGAPCELSKPLQAAPPATPLLIQILTSCLQPEEKQEARLCQQSGLCSLALLTSLPLVYASQIGSFCCSG